MQCNGQPLPELRFNQGAPKICAVMAIKGKNTGILLIDCPDQRGIVLAVADFLYGHNANIVHADQHQDIDTKLFFMRVEWELEQFQLPLEGFAQRFKPIADRFGMRWRLRSSAVNL